MQGDASVLCRYSAWTNTTGHVYAGNFFMPPRMVELYYDNRHRPYVTRFRSDESGKFVCKFERRLPHIGANDRVYFVSGSSTNGEQRYAMT